MIIPFKLNYDINSTSNKTAVAEALVLRENLDNRIVFIPKIVDKDNEWAECISGSFIVQRKSRNGSWKDVEGINLSQLKQGEWTKFDISSKEIINALKYCEELQKMCSREKNLSSITNKQVLILDDNIEKSDILNIVERLNNDEDKIGLVKDIIEESDNWNEIFSLLCEDTNKDKLLKVINELSNDDKENIVTEINIDRINPSVINSSLDNSDESYWQDLFRSNPCFISFAIPSMLHLICDQPYLGGKAIDNKGGTFADFIYSNNINNVAIIEIKTPTTKLLSTEYRNNVYSPSKELGSAIVQVKKQMELFMKSYEDVKSKSASSGIDYTATIPKSYLIIGKTEGLNSEEIASFNLFRNELRDVEVLTFDELYQKLKFIYDLLIENR